MTAANLETQRAELTERLNRLRMSPEADRLVREADAALATYRQEIASIEERIAELDRELGTRERDRRVAEAEERRTRWLDQRQQLLNAEEERLQAIADADAAARDLVKSIYGMLAANKKMTALAQHLSTTKKVPSSLNDLELARRTAGRSAAVMATIKGYPHRLGHLEWNSGGIYRPDQSWREAEEKYMAAQLIQPLLTKGKA